MPGADPKTPTDLFGQPADPHAASSATPEPVGFVLVAPERGVDLGAGGFTYRVPPTLPDLAVGQRVIVPLGRGNQPVAGFVLERTADCPLPADKRAKVKPVLSRDEQGTALPADLVQLARWVASYYVCPLGMVFGTMLPAAVKHGTGATARTFAALPEPDAIDQKLTKLQQAVVDALRDESAAGRAWVELRTLADLAGARSLAPVKALIDKGVLRSKREQSVESDLDLRARREAGDEPPGKPRLSPQQQAALDHLDLHLNHGFSVHLVHGVTGSGKTEVYLRAIEGILGDRRSAICDVRSGQPQIADRTSPIEPPSSPGVIVLVPEIALTPQTVGRFLGRFDHGGVAVLHSGLTAAQRHVQWRRIRSGEAHIVVGARSAIFAPLPNPKLIIVDEEHESSYKQDQLPRYHARDVAIKRGQLLDVPVILGSATPSLESYFNATKRQGPRGQGAKGSSEETTRDTEDSKASILGPSTLGPSTPRPLGPSPYHLISLPDRVPGMTLPKVEVVDMIEERRQRRGIHLLSRRLEHELTRCLIPNAARQTPDATPSQAILLLNRRGYANYIACPDHGCGWMMRCDHCDVTMVYHLNQGAKGFRGPGAQGPRGSGAQGPSGPIMRDTEDSKASTLGPLAPRPLGPSIPAGIVCCHHCGAEQILQPNCPDCGNKTSIFGLGTQRVEEELERKFPGVRAIRMDSDAMRTARHYREALDRFRAGEADVLLGTQMIAKGLDFPGVRLVGVISADTSLHLPDFRAAERTFQLISQVSGRSGRSAEPGKVVVQTFSADDPVIGLAAAHDYGGFARRELALRAEVGLPPVSRMARIVVRDRDHTKAVAEAKALAAHLHAFNQQLKLGVRLRGPSPCPLSRVADHHRHQVELLAPDAVTLQKLMTALRNARLLKSDAHTAVDVDPVALL